MGICGIILLGVGLLFGRAELGYALQGSISAGIALAAAVLASAALLAGLMHRRPTTWPLLLLLLACRKEEALHPAPPVPIPAATPRFALLSPTAGDTLVEGRTYIIRWVAVPPRRIDLGAAMGGHDKGLLLSNAPSSVDSLVWTVPVGFVTGFGPASSDQIRLRLEDADSTDHWVETGPFVILGTPRR